MIRFLSDENLNGDIVRAGLPMPGVFEVPEWLGVGAAIEDLVLIAGGQLRRRMGRPGSVPSVAMMLVARHSSRQETLA